MPHLTGKIEQFLCLVFLVFAPKLIAQTQACPLADGSWGRCLEFTGYQKADEKPVTMRAIIRPARKPTQKAPIYLLAGGPGQAASEAFSRLTEPFHSLSQHHDIVILDQRGTGQSSPLSCPMPDSPLDFYFDKSHQQKFLDTCRDELTQKYTLSAFTTFHAVQDIEVLRQKLGHGKIILYGISYGTRVAIQYAKLYESNLAKMILEGVLSHDYSLLGHPQDFYNALEKVFTACMSQTSCQQSFGDVKLRYQNLHEKFTSPQLIRLQDPFSGRHVEVKVDHRDLDRALFAFLYQGQTISLVPKLLQQAEEGNFQGLFSQLIGSRSENLATGLYLNIVCSEDFPFWPQGLKPFDSFLAASCASWPRYQLTDPSLRQAQKIQIPTLMLSGGLDPVTPPSYASELKKSFSQAEHIHLDWFSHNIHPVKCVQDNILQFLNDHKSIKGCTADLTSFHFFQQRSPLP